VLPLQLAQQSPEAYLVRKHVKSFTFRTGSCVLASQFAGQREMILKTLPPPAQM